MKNLLFHTFYGRLLIFLFSYLFLVSPANGLSQWEKIQEKGYLTWVTRPSPLTYYTSLEGVIGLEFDILEQFCEENGIELVVFSADSNEELFSMFDGFNVDVAGANLALTKERANKYSATISYDETFVSLISSLSQPKIKTLPFLEDLEGAILNHSSYVKYAQNLIADHNTEIKKIDGKSLYELLQMVRDGTIDYTLADSNIIKIFSAYIPKLRIGKKLSSVQELVFYTRNNGDDSLKVMLDKFIVDYKFQNKVDLYKEFLIKTLPNSKPADTVQFLKNYRRRWPKVRELIYSVAQKYDLDPIFLGAISYQESHWNPKAVSPTLVKGLMMLTKGVAQEQDVLDRFDSLQSLEGGAKHFIKVKKIIPDRIAEKDKINFALAAYNIGYGNLEKARILTQKDGKNPDLWSDVKLYLPLLNTIKGSKIDGKTAVRYVENIHVYQNLLQWKEQQHIKK